MLAAMKPNLLVLNASARISRSLTRRLTQRFADTWSARHPDGVVVHRDLGLTPPPSIDEAWIAAAYTPPDLRTPEMHAALELSETLIAEIEAASLIVIGSPLYNFGMPAALKAWLDQIVRVDRTFAIEDNATNPYRALLQSKPVVVLTSAGSAAFQLGGDAAHLNFLEPHLATLLSFIGLTEHTFLRIGDAEYKNEHYLKTLAAAESSLDALAA
jgi:FMN-dependent NADH-azoreductase